VKYSKNIYKAGKLNESATDAKIAIVQKEGNHKQKSLSFLRKVVLDLMGAEIQGKQLLGLSLIAYFLSSTILKMFLGWRDSTGSAC
jgi:hypothetical protein